MCKLANCSAGKGLENFNAIWSIGINSDNRIKIIVPIILKVHGESCSLSIFGSSKWWQNWCYVSFDIKTKYYIHKWFEW